MVISPTCFPSHHYHFLRQPPAYFSPVAIDSTSTLTLVTAWVMDFPLTRVITPPHRAGNLHMLVDKYRHLEVRAFQMSKKLYKQRITSLTHQISTRAALRPFNMSLVEEAVKDPAAASSRHPATDLYHKLSGGTAEPASEDDLDIFVPYVAAFDFRMWLKTWWCRLRDDWTEPCMKMCRLSPPSATVDESSSGGGTGGLSCRTLSG